jgi:hypothetical protein
VRTKFEMGNLNPSEVENRRWPDDTLQDGAEDAREAVPSPVLLKHGPVNVEFLWPHITARCRAASTLLKDRP